MNAFANVSTADLERLLQDVANKCVEIVSMPPEQRHRVGPKGEASPEQAGTLSAVAAFHMMRELERRAATT